MLALIAIGVVAVVLVLEIAFRFALRARTIRFEPPPRLRDQYVEPHPYLPYVFRRSVRVPNEEPAPYTLHRGEYELREIRTNSWRGIGDEPVSPRPAGLVRILCLGHSSTENSVWEVGRADEHSYPLELGRFLGAEGRAGRYEVVNAGVGGWTTAEILVHFVLRLIDLRPDIVVLYHGLNDLIPSLTPGFMSDYAHSRRSYAGFYWRTRLASRLPDLRWWKSYSYATMKLIGYGNSRYDVLPGITAASADLDAAFAGLATERRNVEQLIHLCRANGIRLVLSTFVYYMYAGATDDPAKRRYREGVGQENEMVRSLATAHSLPLVDIDAEIPHDDAHFLDSVHFTPLGMRFVARRFGEEILRLGPGTAGR